MANKPPSDLWLLSIAARRNSARWFEGSNVDKDLSHQVLALCGEAGALANIIKLIDRGELDQQDAHAHFELVMKLVDAFVYILNIAALLECDLLRAYELKTIENERRFVEGKTKKEAQQAGWQQLEYT